MRPPRTVLSPSLYPGARPGGEDDVAAGEAHRAAGNAHYGAGDYAAALASYSACVLASPADHVAYSNRSACFLQLERYEDAFDDAERCTRLAPSYAKGYLRRGGAEWALNRRADARRSFEAGLAAEPGHARLAEELARCAARTDTSPHGAARAAMYRTMVASPALDVEGLFDLLQDPDRITAEVVAARATQLDGLMAYLAKTLEVDLVVLETCAPLREAYDRATFACGQLLSNCPGAASRLPSAPRVVDALRHACRCGWRMEPRARSHGVSKFAANALAVVAAAGDADDGVRRRAARHLLGCALQWLLDATPEPAAAVAVAASPSRPPPPPPAPAPAASALDFGAALEAVAATVGQAVSSAPAAPPAPPADDDASDDSDDDDDTPEASAQRESQRIVCGCGALSPRLSAATWLERVFERGVPPWIRDECAAHHDGELLLVHVCVAVRDERAPPLGLPGLVRCLAPRLMASEIRVDLFVRPEWRWDAAVRVADRADRESTKRKATDEAPRPRKAPHGGDAADDAVPPGAATRSAAAAALAKDLGDVAGDAKLARKLQRRFDEDAIARSRGERTGLPPRRLGEWVAASLGYLLLFVDGDDLFAAHACAALTRLAACDGSSRVSTGLWCGVPLLEKLSAFACKDANAVQFLECLARKETPARLAMLSLAAALAGEDAAAAGERGDGGGDGGGGDGAAAPMDEDAPAPADAARGGGSDAAAPPTEDGGAAAAAAADDDDADMDDGGAPPAADHDESSAPTPSWAEYFHELRGTLGVGGSAGEADDMVLLSNFDAAAAELPIAGELVLGFDDGTTLKVPAVPAAWNERFADATSSAALIPCDGKLLGSDRWRALVRPQSALLLDRSLIRKSPAAPDWATAVQLAADAGAAVVVVVNDLFDDGASRPAFRMGVFGAKPPKIAGFMVCGGDGERVKREAERRAVVSVDVTTIRNARGDAGKGAAGASLAGAPVWPLRGVPRDTSQAWALAEAVASAVPSPALDAELRALTARMVPAEKRVWLARRLQRHHRAAQAVDDDEAPLAFVECDRHAPQLPQLRRQFAEETGLGAPSIVGDFEVRFKGESAVGSAVLREWMDVCAHRAFVAGGGRLLKTHDHGRSFVPNAAALFANGHWRSDFEALGRLFGLAIWQQVTLDLPLHAYVCEALLNDGELPDRDDSELLEALDPDLERSLRWISDEANDVSGLCLDFTDALVVDDPDLPGLDDASEATDAPEAPPPRGAPRVVSLDRDVLTDGDAPLAPGSSVELCAGGAARDVDASNRHDFVRAMRDWRLRKSLRLPLEAVARGLRRAVPRDVLVDARKMLSADDFGRLLSGLRDVDVRFPASCVRREDFARSAAVFFRTAASSSRDINPGESESHPRVPLTRAALVP